MKTTYSKGNRSTCDNRKQPLALKPCLQFDVNREDQCMMAAELKQRFPVDILQQSGNTVLLLRSLVWEVICLIEKREERRQKLFSNLCLHFHNYFGKVCSGLDVDNSFSSLEPSQRKFRSTLKELILKVNANVQNSEKLDVKKQSPLFISSFTPKLLLENELSVVAEKTSLLESSRYNKEFVNLGIIEKGGFGTVCKVAHVVDGCMYALKIIPFRYRSLVAFQKIMQEVKVFANISSHQNVIQYKTSWLEECVFEKSNEDAHREKFEALDEKTEESDKYVVFENSENLSGAKDTLKFTNAEKFEDSLESSATYSVKSNCHSNVVATCSSMKSKNNGAVLYIQMELCDKNLKTWIQERNSNTFTTKNNFDIFESIDVEEPLRIFRDILMGIDYIHEKSLIHRDIKPQNILFSFDGTVKIADFGLSTFDISHKDSRIVSTLLSDSSGNLIEHTIGLGTSVYAAPEQKNSSHYDRKVDIYSLGFVLLELIYPFATNMEKAVCFENLAKKQTLPENLHRRYPNISRIIIEMTSPHPASRPDAKQILQAMNYINKDQKLILELQHKVQCLTSQLLEKDKEIECLRAALRRAHCNQTDKSS